MALVSTDHCTHVSVTSGSWSDTNTWASGSVPTQGARVLISDDHVVTVDEVHTESVMTIRVDGCLKFAADRDTALRCDTLVVSEIGFLQVGSQLEPIESAYNATITIEDLNGGFDTNSMSPDYDPYHLGQGIIVLGKVEMHGASKDSYAAIEAIPAGSTSLTFPTTPHGWKVGDLIALAGYSADGSGDELRQISSINNNGRTVHFTTVKQPEATVSGRIFSSTAATAKERNLVSIEEIQSIDPSLDSWQALTERSNWNNFPRQPWRRDADGNQIPLTDEELAPQEVKAMLHVINLSRNVSIVSEFSQRNQTVTYKDAALGLGGNDNDITEFTGRGHMMLMHHNRGDIRNVAFDGMGRTDLNEVQRNPTWSANGSLAEPAYNPFGRNALTIQFAQAMCGASDPARIYSCTFTDSIGMGLLNKGSNVRVENSASYVCRLAGFAVHEQDSIGTFINNIALCGETGFHIEAHYLRVEDNIVAGFSRAAYNFDTKGGVENVFDLSRPTYFDAEIDGDQENLNPLFDNVLTSRSAIVTRNNTAYGGHTLINGSYYMDATHINLFGHGILNGMDRWYTYDTAYINPILLRDHNSGLGMGDGLGHHNNSGKNSFINPTVLGFRVGVYISAGGHEEIIGGTLANIMQILCNTRPEPSVSSKIFKDITFLELDPEIQPEMRRVDISLMRANHFNGGADGYNDIIELHLGNNAYRLYPARETHPDYIPHLVTDIAQPEPQTVRYFGYTNQQIYNNASFQYSAEQAADLGAKAYWFSNCRPPLENLANLTFPSGYSPDDHLDPTERPTYNKEEWMDHWVQGRFSGLELQNATIEKNYTAQLRPRIFRVRDLIINNGEPLTDQDLSYDEASGSYYYDIDCKSAYFDPAEDDGLLRSEFEIAYSSFIDSIDGREVVTHAEFQDDGILRLTFNPDTSGRHYITISCPKANKYKANITESILINYQGSLSAGPLVAVDDGPIAGSDQAELIIPINSLLINDAEAIRAARQAMEAEGKTLAPESGIRLAQVDAISEYGAEISVIENTERNVLNGEIIFSGETLDTTEDAQIYMANLIDGDTETFCWTKGAVDSAYMRVEFPASLVEEINMYSSNNKLFYNLALTLELNGEVVYQRELYTPESGTWLESNWCKIIVPPGIQADAWQITLLYHSDYDQIANANGNRRIRLNQLEILGPKYDALRYLPGENHYALGNGESMRDTFNYTIEDYGFVGEYVNGSRTNIIAGAWRQASAEVVVNVSGNHKPPLGIDDQVNSGDVTPSQWYASYLLSNDINTSTGPLEIDHIDSQSEHGVPISWDANNGTIAYHPAGYFTVPQGEVVWDSFTYTPRDNTGQVAQQAATVNVRILGEQKESIAVDDEFTTMGMSPLNITTDELFANDVNQTIVPLTLTSWSSESKHGVKISLNEENHLSLIYDTPSIFGPLAPGETALDEFSYTMSDANGSTSTAKVTVKITGNYAAPIAINDHHSNLADLTLAADYPNHIIAVGSLLANDITPDPNPTFSCGTITSAGCSLRYTAGDPVIYYDPTPILMKQEFLTNGEYVDSFTYTLSDSQGASDTAKVTIKLLAKANTGFARKIKFGVPMPRYLLPKYSGNTADPGEPVYIDSDWVFAGMESVSEQLDGSIFGWKSKETAKMYTERTVKEYFPSMLDFYTVIDKYEMEWSYIVMENDDVWEIAVPKGAYDVHMTLGATDTRLSDDSITIEGRTYFLDDGIDYNREETVTKTIEVADGFLTIQALGDATPVIVAIELSQLDYPEEGLLGATPDNYQAFQGETLVVPAPGLLANDATPSGATSVIVKNAGNKKTTRGQLNVNEDGSFTYEPPEVALGRETFEYRLETIDADGQTRMSNTTTVTIDLRGAVGMNVIYQASELAGTTSGEGIPWIECNGLSASNTTDPFDGLNYGWSSNLYLLNSRLSPLEDVGVLYAAGAEMTGNNRSWSMYDLAPGRYELSCWMGSTSEDPNSRGYHSYPQNNSLCINGVEIHDPTTSDGPTLNNLERVTTIVEIDEDNPNIRIDAGENSSYPVLAALTIRSVIDNAPVALDQSVALDEDDTIEIILSSKSSSTHSLTYTIVDPPANGNVSLDGNIASYTPRADYFGIDRFSFKVNDGSLASYNLGYIQLEIRPVNDAPVAEDAFVSMHRNGSIAIELLANDVENDPLTYHIVDSPRYGKVTVIDNIANYTANVGYYGNDKFTFKANDGEFDSQPATISIDISSSINPPLTGGITTPAAEPADQGSTTGSYVIRERGNDDEANRHISAFFQYDLSLVGDFDPVRGDSAEITLSFEGILNTGGQSGLWLGRITGGSWNTTDNKPQYAWATLSGEPVGPGSQEDETLITSNVTTVEIGTQLITDVTHIVDSWINGTAPNYGIGIYLDSLTQGAGFGQPELIIHKNDAPTELTGYTGWITNYSSLSDENQSMLADPNRSGLSNLLEYALGGDPTSSDRSHHPRLQEDEFTFNRYPDRDDIEYIVQQSTDLASWQPVATFRSHGLTGEVNPDFDLRTTAGSPESIAISPNQNHSAAKSFIRLLVRVID
ncbi:Ig-like domain-containing protein [Persicirhabdus sediminis]|uniref:Tandem-95 repeat protein n=1 Tax=Persicirhabdus sediminis TaxID=454144 RepID=A0A8J7MCM1_9BACT|nr:Ig-like domain-containing protein [Persicirhabdus sediminis]MBK1790138.1 tandem-95 repeat protein [Persicirhabdus sediminis]